MKTLKNKLILFVLSFLVLGGLLLPETISADTNKQVKILYIGNSHSKYSTRYLSDILSQCGYSSVVLGNCYCRGMDLKFNFDSAINDNKNHCYRKNTTGKWQTISELSYSVADAINDEDWDYIILQNQILAQANPDSYVYDKEGVNASVLEDFTSYIHDYSNAKLVWNVLWPLHTTIDQQFEEVWQGDSEALYAAILATTKQEIYNKNLMDTYIWSAPVIESLYSSYLKDFVIQDGRHANTRFGAFASGLCIAKALGADISKVSSYSFKTPVLSTAHINSIRETIQKSWRNPWAPNIFDVSYRKPLQPINVKISPKQSCYRLSWNKISRACGYQIQQYSSKKKQWVTVAMSYTNFYNIQKKSLNAASRFRVIALGDNFISSVVSKTIDIPALKPPIFQKHMVNHTSIMLTLHSTEKVSTYEIMYSKFPNMAHSKKISVKASAPKYIFKNLNQNHCLYFKLRSTKTMKSNTFYSNWSKTYTLKKSEFREV